MSITNSHSQDLQFRYFGDDGGGSVVFQSYVKSRRQVRCHSKSVGVYASAVMMSPIQNIRNLFYVIPKERIAGYLETSNTKRPHRKIHTKFQTRQ